MIETLTDIDTSIFLFFNNTLRQSWLDSFMMIFSGRWVWVPMYASLLYIMLRSMPPLRVIIFVLAAALTIALADQTCASIIRPVVQRLRPSNPENPLSALTMIVNGYRGGAYGFPSCHAANSFALAVFSSLLLHRRRFTIFIFMWATFNSYTRIHLGVHYPGDLLAGAIIGSFYGWICYSLGRLLTPDAERRETLSRLNLPAFSIKLPRRQRITICSGDIMIAVGTLTLIGIIITSVLV